MAQIWLEGKLTLHCSGCGVLEQVSSEDPWTTESFEPRYEALKKKHARCPVKPAPRKRSFFLWNFEMSADTRYSVSAIVCAESAVSAREAVFAELQRKALEFPVSEKRLQLLQQAEAVHFLLGVKRPNEMPAHPWDPYGVQRADVYSETSMEWGDE